MRKRVHPVNTKCHSVRQHVEPELSKAESEVVVIPEELFKRSFEKVDACVARVRITDEIHAEARQFLRDVLPSRLAFFPDQNNIFRGADILVRIRINAAGGHNRARRLDISIAIKIVLLRAAQRARQNLVGGEVRVVADQGLVDLCR